MGAEAQAGAGEQEWIEHVIARELEHMQYVRNYIARNGEGNGYVRNFPVNNPNGYLVTMRLALAPAQEAPQ